MKRSRQLVGLSILLAVLGPKNVALAGEIADGWLPVFFSPEHTKTLRGPLEEGAARAGRSRLMGRRQRHRNRDRVPDNLQYDAGHPRVAPPRLQPLLPPWPPPRAPQRTPRVARMNRAPPKKRRPRARN